MTTAPARPDVAVPAPPAVTVPASSRVSLLVGDEHQIDLLLPAAVPLSRLIEPTRDAINQRLRAIGAEELPGETFVFARAAGMTMLAENLSLSAQGVNDADLLAFVPTEAAQRYEPNIENVSAAIAKWAKAHFPAVSATDTARVAMALTLVAVAVAGLLVWRIRWAGDGGWLAPTLFAGTAAVFGGGALLGARMGADRLVTAASTWASWVLFVVAAVTTPPDPRPGAPHAFLAAVVALAGAAGVAKLTRRYQAATAAITTGAAAVAAVAAARMFLDIPGQRIAVVVLVGVLTVSLAAPALGRRMAKVPRQSFESITGKDMYSQSPTDPEDTISPVADSPRDITLTGAQVAAIARRSNRVLQGVLAATGAAELAASWCAINPGVGTQWTFVTVVAAIGGIEVLRARAFRDRRHSVTVAAAAALSLFAIPAHYGLAADPMMIGTGLWSAVAVVAIALGALAAGLVVPNYPFSEPVREIVEYAEYLATTTVVVFAAWTIHLVQFVRYH
jgi:type VII secretion integral membrane protein EccD